MSDDFPLYDESLRVTFEDLSARFFLNLPTSEFSQWERVFYQLEQAHWYYEDFLRVENAMLPKLKLREFCKCCFELCLVLRPYLQSFEELFASFQQYLFSVPVCGAILLNHSFTKCLLVKGYGSKSWGFPKGKINQGESEVDCAIREALEEIGYDISPLIDPDVYLQGHDKEMKLFVVFNVDENFAFETRTRKEISDIKWFEIESLMQNTNAKGRAKFWNVRPFLPALKKLLSKGRQKTRRSASIDKAAGTGKGKKKGNKNKKSEKVSIHKDSTASGYQTYGDAEIFGEDSKGWSVEEMFKINELRFGIRSTYISDVDDLAQSMARSGYQYKDLRNKGDDATSLSNSSSSVGQSWPTFAPRVGAFGDVSFVSENEISDNFSANEAVAHDDSDVPEFQFDMEGVMTAFTSALKSS